MPASAHKPVFIVMKANFIEINSPERLEDLFARSYEVPVLLFKHSISCPISSEVHRIVADIDADVHLIVVQTARHVSNAVAEKTGVRHESPQAIILKDGRPVYAASHFDVAAEDMKEFLDN